MVLSMLGCICFSVVDGSTESPCGFQVVSPPSRTHARREESFLRNLFEIAHYTGDPHGMPGQGDDLQRGMRLVLFMPIGGLGTMSEESPIKGRRKNRWLRLLGARPLRLAALGAYAG